MLVPKRGSQFIRVLLLFLLVPLVFAFDFQPVSADAIVVDTTVDENGENDNNCSLREAIKSADTDTAIGGCVSGDGADIITVPAGVYTVSAFVDFTSTDITIVGESPETTIIQASTCNPTEATCANDHQFAWVSSGSLTLKQLTMRYWNNTSDLNGGVLYSQSTLNIDNCHFVSNRASRGAALANFGGTLTVSESYFSSNMAKNAADNFVDGGALHNSLTGTMTIEKSTFSSNHGDYGGAIYNWGTIEVINSTFSGNTAENLGGAINNEGTLTVTNSTFSGNSGSNGAGINNGTGDTLNLINTIIANSVSGSDCRNSGYINTNTANLVEDGSCSAAFSGDPSLGVLADNGGATPTHALQPGSSAIDAGNNEDIPATDQRGVDRPQGTGCDIGAFEFFPAEADFAGSPTTGAAPLLVTFTNQSTGDYDTCDWDFGDGLTSDDCSPAAHAYTAPGTYTVALTVDGLGGEDTLTQEAYIIVTGFRSYLPLMMK